MYDFPAELPLKVPRSLHEVLYKTTTHVINAPSRGLVLKAIGVARSLELVLKGLSPIAMKR